MKKKNNFLKERQDLVNRFTLSQGDLVEVFDYASTKEDSTPLYESEHFTVLSVEKRWFTSQADELFFKQRISAMYSAEDIRITILICSTASLIETRKEKHYKGHSYHLRDKICGLAAFGDKING